jgi:energy-coupling factor transporter ATP-binding protein EcfA2
MHIEELNIRGYGRLSNLRIEPSPGLNVILGGPGSGKTTLANCLRDLLLGPGQWEGEGPRVPAARPWSGDRFQARVRYKAGTTAYTVQRDFDEPSTRARDDAAGQEIPMPDPRGPAPGVQSVPSGDGGGLTREVAAWEWRVLKGTVADLEARLLKAEGLEREAAELRPQVERNRSFAEVDREQRDAVIRASARLHTLEREVADGTKILDGLKESRRDVGTRLSAFEPFFKVTPGDLEMIKNLDLTEGPSTSQIEEKERNLRGFDVKEADIRKRLEEIGTRFQNVDDDFETHLNDQERELGRSEAANTAKAVERDRIQGQIDPLRGSSRSYLMYALVAVAVGALIVALGFRSAGSKVGYILGGVSVALVGGGGALAKKSADDRRLHDLEAESARVGSDMSQLRTTIDSARDQVRRMLSSAGVETIKDLRSLYREFRSLQRDAETVRAFRKELERDLEAARKAGGAKKVETPKLLIECKVLGEGEPPTPRAVADFFEAYHQFKALQQEEDGLKKRLSELQTDLVGKETERDQLRATRAKALEAMGVKSEAEMDGAIAGRREYDRVKSQLEVVEEKLHSVLRGLSWDEAEKQTGDARSRLAALEADDGGLASLDHSPDRLEEYRGRLAQAREALAAAGPCAVGAGPEGGIEEAVAAAWLRVTGQPLEVRRQEGALEVREGARTTWISPSLLGSVGARLIEALAEGERARRGGEGAPPALLDEPLAMIDDEGWRERLIGWLLELSDAVQTFVFLSGRGGRDALRAAVAGRGMAVTESREEALEILTVGASVASAG